jgi:hypothetical protein
MALPLVDIQDRLSRASRGPWRYSGQQVMIGHGVGSSYAVTVKKREDGEFIASARTDVEGLVREVARLRNGLQEAHRGLSTVHRHSSGTVAEMIDDLSAEVAKYL